MEELKYFFSYSRKDSGFVLRLAKELRAAGANVWLDQLDILGGEHWDDTVEKTLKSCKGVIAVLSPDSVASSNVMDEVSYALDEGKPVVPVLIRSCDIPLRLRRLQYIDFAADYDTGFSQLLKALHIEQAVEPLESAVTREPVVQESTAPLEAKPTEPPVHEEQAAQEVEEPSPPEASEPIPDELDHPKPTGLETEKVEEPLLPKKPEPTPDEQQPDVEALSRAAYTITASAGAGGSISPSGKTTIDSEANQSFTITPEAGYQIADVVVDGASVGAVASYTFTNVTADHTITASFAIKTYSLTATTVNGTVTKIPYKATYHHGETVTLEAVAESGYTFTGWSGDLSGSTNPADLVMDGDKSVTASFTRNTYTLEVNAIDGSVTVSPDQASYNHGETVTLEAVPNDGYCFKNWSGDLSGSANPATLVMNADKVVTAHFAVNVLDRRGPTGVKTEKAPSTSQKTKVLAVIFIVALIILVLIAVLKPKTHGLHIRPADNGSVRKDPDKASYNHGEKVILTAVPNDGYSFASWSGALSGNTNPADLVMDADKSVTASFVLKTYSLMTPPPMVGGSVKKDANQASYKHGDTVTLEAIPNDGYLFMNWSGDLSGSTKRATLVMNADKSVTANFIPKTYNLDIPPMVGGSVKKDPNQASYKHGDTVTLEAIPNDGYLFTNWSGALSGSTNPADLVMDADKSVTASFAIETCSLTATAEDREGKVIKDPNQASYNHGEKVILTAVPNDGYSFASWSGDLSGSENPTTLVMNADKSVTASFAIKTYSLTATAEDREGKVIKDPNQASYNHDEMVELKAVPNPGYSFTKWSGDLSGSENPTTLVMNADKGVTASFALKTYSLDILHAVGGSVKKSPDKTSYKHGDTVTLEAVPNPEYIFTKWSGDLSDSNSPTKLVMDSDKSVTAKFATIKPPEPSNGGCEQSPYDESSVSDYMLPYLLLLGVWTIIKRRDASRRNAVNRPDKPAASDSRKET